MSATAPAAARAAMPDSGAAGELRTWLKAQREALKTRYFKRPDPQRTLEAYSALIDQLLQQLWSNAALPPGIALVAVGGYGRGALYPHSDVDVLVLLPDGMKADAGAPDTHHPPPPPRVDEPPPTKTHSRTAKPP